MKCASSESRKALAAAADAASVPATEAASDPEIFGMACCCEGESDDDDGDGGGGGSTSENEGDDRGAVCGVAVAEDGDADGVISARRIDSRAKGLSSPVSDHRISERPPRETTVPVQNDTSHMAGSPPKPCGS